MPPSANSAAPPSTYRRRILLTTLIVIGVSLLAWVWRPPRAATPEAPQVFQLDTFVLNLSDPEQRAYLRVGVAIACRNTAVKRAEELPLPLLRDAVVNVLAAANADEVLQAGGKAKLKEELRRELARRAPQLGVEEVYFTEFLVQR